MTLAPLQFQKLRLSFLNFAVNVDSSHLHQNQHCKVLLRKDSNEMLTMVKSKKIFHYKFNFQYLFFDFKVMCLSYILLR